MDKVCIFNKGKRCDDCGECDICDLNPNKKCNNCGKCLELEGYDVKAIEIDDIFESAEDEFESEQLNKLHDESNEELKQDEEFWGYIDDIKELKDIVEDEEKHDLYEEFPGLFVYKTHENKSNEDN